MAHIFGTTRHATMFAQGYTGAEDRLFFMDALRHVGRARLSEFLGPSPANQAMDRAQLTVAPYTDADLVRQVGELAASGPRGGGCDSRHAGLCPRRQLLHRPGPPRPLKLPAEYPALQQLPKPWSAENTVAVGPFIGAQLGKGGGAELANLCGLHATAAELGDGATARRSSMTSTSPTTRRHPPRAAGPRPTPPAWARSTPRHSPTSTAPR